MRKILLIDKGESSLHRFSKSISSRGYQLVNEQKVKNSLSRLQKNAVDVLVISSDFAPEISRSKKFRKLTADKPRIILTGTRSPKTLPFRSSDLHTVYIKEPFTFREFMEQLEKALKIRNIENENLELHSRLNTRNKEFYFFNNMMKSLNSASGLRKGLISMMDQVKSLTAAETWSILLNDEPIFEIIPIRSSRKIQKFVFNKNIGFAGWVLDNGTHLNIRDASKDKRFSRKVDSMENLRVKSMLCVPLKIKNRVVGVLRLINKNRTNAFNDEDLKLSLITADFAAMAIERAFLYQKTKYDELTNLYNASYLKEAIETEIQRAERYGSLFSILFMDIDDFKTVNDRYGHLVGSRILVEMAQILQRNLRRIDIITRYGGDEYVIILPQTSRQVSFLIAERLRKTIEKNIFLKHNGYSIRLTSSFGIASYPDNAKSKDDLLRIADNAMYHGKFLTKNVVYAAK